MRLVGTELFASYDLGVALGKSLDRFTRDACFDAILSGERLTKLALRRAMIAATERIAPPVLRSVTITEPNAGRSSHDMVASCTIAYDGLPDLLFCRVETAKSLRPILAAVKRGMIALRAEGEPGTGYLALPLLAAELALIEHCLDLQRGYVAQWRRHSAERIRHLAVLVHDDLDRTALRRLTRRWKDHTMQRELAREELWRELTSRPST